MGVAEDVFTVIGPERPENWTDERETAVRALFDRMSAAILADDEPTALAALTELHENEPDIAHRLFAAAFEHVQNEPIIVVIDLRSGGNRGQG